MNPEPTEWPQESLEPVPLCPVCGSNVRDLAHADLIDDTFFAAPGKWNLWQCRSCLSGWLDPRPDRASIGNAYSSYFTHVAADPATIASGSTGLRHRLGNGYRNWRFGTNMEPASVLGPMAAAIMPAVRRRINEEYRMLPRPDGSARRTVLDIGCGNGAYLLVAREAGWNCLGTEPDAIARKAAQALGFDVRPSPDDFDETTGSIDYVTLSHVIEHLHSPEETLGAAHLMLVPNGGIFIATPNMEAIGHQIYGRHWRGLETPRHLMLFSRQSLSRLLRDCGFTDLRFYPCPSALNYTSEQSRKIAAGENPDDLDAHGIGRWPSHTELRQAERPGRHSELLILTARKA